MSDRLAELDRARNYPYAIPEESYIWRGGATARFDPAARRNRTPVLAIGSNRSPQQLSRKFGEDGAIPVQRATLRNFDIYYSAHITRYGAVPAMLQSAAGAGTTVSVTWLDERQLEIMHETELSAAKYRYGAIEDIELALDCGTTLDSVNAYVGVSGHLTHEGDAIALSAVRATGRRPQALSTAEVLEIVRARFAPDHGSDEFVFRLIDDPGFRSACSDAIAEDAVAFAHPARLAAG